MKKTMMAVSFDANGIVTNQCEPHLRDHRYHQRGAEAATVGGAGPCGRGARGRDRAVQARHGGPRRQEGDAYAGA